MRMEKILSFNSYMINESKEDKSPLYLSKKLSIVLEKIISEPIAKKLLSETNNKDKKFDISYLDIDSDSKNVSYYPSDRLDRIDIDVNKEPSIIDDVWTSKYRQTMSWGKVINRIFPSDFTNMDIDRFYNRYRPEIDINEKEKSRFEVVFGEDIRYWYLYTRWDGKFGSCMQGEHAQKFFDYYCNNPERCGLLIYRSEKKPDKIIGRSLVWNNLVKPSGDTAEDKNPYTLMDRVYFINDNQTQIEAAFHKYAVDHKWIYKRGDQFLMNGERKTTSVTTRLKPVEYKYYPYVDTMSYYTPATGRASSTPGNQARDLKNPSKIFQRYNLRSQDGGKTLVDR